MSKTTLRKRQRQQAQHERQLEKVARREARKDELPPASRSVGQEDPDLQGMVPGPQHPHDESGG
ncbi:hypothetical protein [Petrachloros mirabilis]